MKQAEASFSHIINGQPNFADDSISYRCIVAVHLVDYVLSLSHSFFDYFIYFLINQILIFIVLKLSE